MKKIIKLTSLLLIVCLISGCFNNKKEVKKESTDALKFKEEYESLNNDYKEIEIKENNPIKYSSIDEIKDIINNKSGLIFLGNAKDNKSRIIIPILIEAAKQTGIKPIYYLSIDSNEQIKELVNKDLTYPLIIFVKDGEILETIENDKTSLTTEEENSLLKKYRNTIHEILDDLCDQSC